MAKPPINLDAVSTKLYKGINIVEASAGTGKTYSIVMLVLRFVVEHAIALESILLVTFTRAAAAELAERIRLRMQEAIACLEGRENSEDEGLSSWLDALADRQGSLEKLKSAIREIDRASIFTIHSFCQRVLQEHALESAQLFDMELKPDVEKLRHQLVCDFWRRKIYDLPARTCAVIVQHFDTPEKLYDSVAPFGVNYTRVEPQAVQTDEMFARFTESYTTMTKWWRQHGTKLVESISLLVDQGKIKKDFSCRFDLWRKDMENYFTGITEKIPEDLKVLETETFAQVVNGSKVRGAKKVELIRELQLPEMEISCFLEAINGVLLAVRRELALYLQSALSVALEQQSCMSYDELISRMHEAVCQPKSGLQQILRKRYQAALVDEFQDTDFQQWQIFHDIFAGKDHFLFLIGDPKQAIYRFRGADINTYFRARSKAAHRYTLEKNYRSHPGLVHSINGIFGLRSEPFYVDRTVLDYRDVVPALAEKDLRLEQAGKSMSNMVFCHLMQMSCDGTGIWGTTKAHQTIIHYVAAEITCLLNGSVEISKKGERIQLEPSDIAILVRTNRQAEDFRQYLVSVGLPAVISTSSSLFVSEECRELHTLLRCLAQPGDGELLKRAMILPWFGLRGGSLFRIWQDDILVNDYHIRFQEYGQLWQDKGVMMMMHRLLTGENVFSTLGSLSQAERKITNINHLVELARQAEVENKFGPHQLISWLRNKIAQESGEDELRLESDEKAVRILTMHGAKGLEFPVVFCPSLWYRQQAAERKYSRVVVQEEEGFVLDLGSTAYEQRCERALTDETAEEMRLLYVALTRAKLLCYVFWADVRGGGRGKMLDSFDSGLGYLLFGGERCDFNNQQLSLRAYTTTGYTEYAGIEENSLEIHTGRNSTSAEGSLETRPFNRHSFYTDWQMVSYSSLVADADHSGNGIKGLVKAPSEKHETPFSTLPSGPIFGNIVHELFERFSFQECADPDIPQMEISAVINRYRLAVDMDLLKRLLAVVVTTNLQHCRSSTKQSLTLEGVPADRCHKEMGFYLRMGKTDTSSINDLLADEKICRSVSARTLQGYLTGFIDLIFERNGVFYIADYKTNDLGDNYDNYLPERLTGEMASHNYGLQLWLYSLVLHRYLQSALPGYDYDSHFGGAYYLFVRGMDSHGHGVFYNKPARAKLEKLGRLMGYDDVYA